ncbi:MAG: hypothetical protein WBH12_00750, partial [Sediminibacterium sp.]
IPGASPPEVNTPIFVTFLVDILSALLLALTYWASVVNGCLTKTRYENKHLKSILQFNTGCVKNV